MRRTPGLERLALSAGLALLTLVTACRDEPPPTAPEEGAELPESAAELPTIGSGNAILSDRAHLLAGGGFDLVASQDELAAGTLRFLSADGEYPDVTRDDFVVADVNGERVVRRVLQQKLDGPALVVETSHADWYEIVNEGTYSLTIPFNGVDGPSLTSGPAAVPIPINGNALPLPPLSHEFQDTDVCQLAQDFVDLFGGPQQTVCGEPKDLEVGAGVTVKIEGTLDSLRILSGDVSLTGDMDISLTVESGGISGGTAPVFSPCNRGNYLGCVSTPTGAALVDWLRTYAPAIPDGSLRPVRLCVPGTPVRVRAGYWSGWTWNPPRFEQCRIASYGTLPTVTLPSVQQVVSEVRPTVSGDVVVRVKGDGAFGIKIAIPYLAASAAYSVTDDFSAKASVGVFVLLRATLKNAGATVRFAFDETGQVTQSWTPEVGWEGDYESVDKDRSAQLLALEGPDSIVVRFGVPIEAKAEVCVALIACESGGNDSTFFGAALAAERPTTPEGHLANGLFDNLNLGAKAGVGISMFSEATWTREQIHPTAENIDNWHIAVESAYDLTLEAGVTIPLTGWILPDVPRSYDETWECCRVRLSDYWGQAKLNVTTATSGPAPDPDGYSVSIERMDTLPDFIVDGSTRVLPFSMFPLPALSIENDGSVIFGTATSFLPCNAVYSDAYLTQGLIPYAAVNGARALGVGIPNYALTTPCPMLVAPYRVELTNVAANCTVEGGAVREDVWLEQSNVITGRSDTKELHFDVTCGDASDLGTLQVVLAPGAAGPNERPHVRVDGIDQGPVPASDTLVITGIMSGIREVSLDRISSFCVVTPETITVVADATTPSQPAVVCALPDPAPLDAVHYEVTTDGPVQDRDGYEMRVDGESESSMPVSGITSVLGRPSEEPQVFFVSGIDGNCMPLGDNPRTIALDAAGNSVTVPFPVQCFDEPTDTLRGVVESTGYPSPVAYLRLENGTALAISGPKLSELGRLGGTTVRAWGRASAAGFAIHGYDLRSTLGDTRWMGIVIDRPDGTWLFGREARRILDAPAALKAASGSLVWIKGTAEADDIRPTLFSVIREGS